MEIKSEYLIGSDSSSTCNVSSGPFDPLSISVSLDSSPSDADPPATLSLSCPIDDELQESPSPAFAFPHIPRRGAAPEVERRAAVQWTSPGRPIPPLLPVAIGIKLPRPPGTDGWDFSGTRDPPFNRLQHKREGSV